MFRGHLHLLAGVLPLLLAGCDHEPTPVQIPAGATSIERFPFQNGRAFQTQYIVRATYPEASVLEFYKGRVGSEWLLCEWGPPGWSHFVDAQGPKPYGVHQQLHMWVNSKMRRTLLLSLRYHSQDEHRTVPDSDLQQIVLVENMSTNVRETIKELDLKCPSGSAGL